MSRTIKKNLDVHSRKMRSYSAEREQFKFKASKSEYVGGYSKGVSAYDKLITKNANRSIKKSMRQLNKKLCKIDYEDEIYF